MKAEGLSPFWDYNSMPVLLVKFDNLVKLYDMPEGKPLFIGSDVDCDIAYIKGFHDLAVMKSEVNDIIANYRDEYRTSKG